MATSAFPPCGDLPSLPESEHRRVLDLLFEPSPAIHELLLPTLSEPFSTYDALVSRLDNQIFDLAAAAAEDGGGSTAATQTLHAILGSHPRLGEPKVHSVQSASEQANINKSGGGGGGEREALMALNAEYEARFPGMRYVVFVNGRGRPEIMADMRRRIDGGDIRAEERAAIQAMCDIARDRARKLLAGDAGKSG